ncbi:HD domain-containing protein [Pseudonocardia ammonioxydans]|uniref:HD domain-containing protein n=1 Tax=Pseudonocardia ammonioxydans TaxID=260086 RepID=UPI000A67AD7D|nr:HD domain-containing protein [Pseudonocardia ammonioxydans]
MASESPALQLARELLADALPARWLHVQAVHAQAVLLGPALSGVDAQILSDAAALHDIGYAPAAARTGFHPLDGARYLADLGISTRVVHLVAHHSCAIREARLRGVDGMSAFSDEATPTRDALWYCDAVTGPRGERFSPDDRWAEVRERYGPDHLVTRFLTEADTDLRAAIRRTESRILGARLAVEE